MANAASSAFQQLIVSNGGLALSAGANLGYGSNANNNAVWVTGAGSSWTNTGALVLGNTNAYGNGLTITAGGGASLGGVLRSALREGWCLPVLPGTRHVTVGGAIAADDFERIADAMLASVAEMGAVDGLLVALHGATVSAAHRDADGEILARLRARLGRLELVEGGRTWRLARVPKPGGDAVPAEEIAPHRLAWLDHDKPERMILRDVEDWFDSQTSREPKDKGFFHPEARADYLAALREPGTVTSICEDYRAAASIDLEHDALPDARWGRAFTPWARAARRSPRTDCRFSIPRRRLRRGGFSSRTPQMSRYRAVSEP